MGIPEQLERQRVKGVWERNGERKQVYGETPCKNWCNGFKELLVNKLIWGYLVWGL